MEIELSPQQIQAQENFRSFVSQEIAPYADQNDQQESTPPEIIKKLASVGYLGAIIPKEQGGQGMDAITFGLLCEEIGRSSASLLSLLTVHGMVCQAILKWGSASQRANWLPKLASGETIGAFGLTEPHVGSDAKSVETTAVISNNSAILNGEKKWISFGQVADLFLIIAQCEGKPSAFLVERKSPGFSTEPITGLLGFRSAMLAKVFMNECQIPAENLVGRIGFGFSHVASTALDHGRYCVGWGCLGLGQACLDACLSYTNERKQFGSFLKGHQLIQQLIADMITNIKAARLLCYHAGYLKEKGDPSLIMETSIAKYFASRMVNKVANDALQIHGANGCSSEYPVQRYLRDAKIMEIIEGSTQMQQIIIAKSGYHSFALEKRRARQKEKA
ncbi:MAG: acyl-CoA dehydrogenase family protein [Candidatus Parabeggiatoa sp.]|nr:acyl-CoA dehydrogenase family protein [Candidatus Parabeggiatoa sp.]